MKLKMVLFGVFLPALISGCGKNNIETVDLAGRNPDDPFVVHLDPGIKLESVQFNNNNPEIDAKWLTVVTRKMRDYEKPEDFELYNMHIVNGTLVKDIDNVIVIKESAERKVAGLSKENVLHSDIAAIDSVVQPVVENEVVEKTTQKK